MFSSPSFSVITEAVRDGHEMAMKRPNRAKIRNKSKIQHTMHLTH